MPLSRLGLCCLIVNAVNMEAARETQQAHQCEAPQDRVGRDIEHEQRFGDGWPAQHVRGQRDDASGHDHRNPLLVCQGAQWFERFWVLANFLGMVVPKLRPARRIVAGPLSQLGAWRQILQPQVHRCGVLGDTTRQKSIDQRAQTVVRCGLSLTWRAAMGVLIETR